MLCHWHFFRVCNKSTNFLPDDVHHLTAMFTYLLLIRRGNKQYTLLNFWLPQVSEFQVWSQLIQMLTLAQIISDPHFSNKSDQHDASWDKLNPNPLWPPSAPWRRLKNGLKMEDPSENTHFFHSGCWNLAHNIPIYSIYFHRSSPPDPIMSWCQKKYHTLS